MKTLQSISRSIQSATGLESIVSTMKAYASSNIIHFQQAAQASEDYTRVLDMALQIVSMQQSDNRFHLQEPEKGWHLHVIFGSDYGLTGRFNERIVAYALEKIPKDERQLLMVVGHQVLMRIRRHEDIVDSFDMPQTEKAVTTVVQRMLIAIDALRKTHPLESIFLHYHQPVGKSSMREQTTRLFPLGLEEIVGRQGLWPQNRIPVVLVDQATLLSDLIQQYFFIVLYRTFCFSSVSENASRLASMQAAEKNIQEHLEELQYQYRQQRQNQITADIADIVSGYKAIRNNKNDGE